MARVPISFATGGADSSELTATKARVLAPYTAITSDSDDEPAAGTMTDKSDSISTAAVSQNGNNIRMKVPANGYYNTNAYMQAAASSFGNAAQNQVLSGATFTSSAGLNKGGSIPSKSAATYNVSSSNQTIASGQYLGGAQTIRGVTTSNIAAGNIKKGVTVQVGDAASSGRIANVAGTYTQVSSGQSAVVAGALRQGYSGFANGGAEVKGSIPDLAAATYNVSTSNRTIAAGSYIAGTQTIRGVTTANIAAGNIKKGVTIQVGDSASAGRIANVAGTYSTVSSGQTALTAGALRKGYSGFANGGSEVKGSIPDKAAQTYYATTSDQTIASGQYLAGAQTIKKVTQSGIAAANIIAGKTITVSNGSANLWSVSGTAKELKYSTAVRVNLGSGTKTFTYKTSYDGTTWYTANTNYVTLSNIGFTPVGLFYQGGAADRTCIFTAQGSFTSGTGMLRGYWNGSWRDYQISGNLVISKNSIVLPMYVWQEYNYAYVWVFGY